MPDYLRVLVLWGFVLVTLSLGVTVLFCLGIQGILEPAICRTVLDFISSTFWGEMWR
jgi:hypothetical protein